MSKQILLAFIVAFLVAQTARSQVVEEGFCPPPPCDIKKDGRAACEAKATWVLEGLVAGTSDKFARECQQFGNVRECKPPGWVTATVSLETLNAVKMPIRVIIDGPPIFSGYGKATLKPANRCWESVVRIPHDAVNKRVRFYGMDKYQNPPRPTHGWPPSHTGEGYFAYEVMD